MKSAIISGRLKKVGNSISIIIPASVRKRLGLVENQQVTIEIKKKKKELDIFGMCGGKYFEFTEEDRLDARY